MQRHHRDRDILWLASGLPFLTWVSATQENLDRSDARQSHLRAAEPDAPGERPTTAPSTDGERKRKCA